MTSAIFRKLLPTGNFSVVLHLKEPINRNTAGNELKNVISQEMELPILEARNLHSANERIKETRTQIKHAFFDILLISVYTRRKQ